MASAKEILSDTGAEIACITETHLSQNKGIALDGYAFFGRARIGKSGGGVGIFVKESLKQRVTPHYSSREIEVM